jgi:hypothetical protein
MLLGRARASVFLKVPLRTTIISVPGRFDRIDDFVVYFSKNEGPLSHYTRRDAIGRSAQMGWGEPDLEFNNLRNGIKYVFESVTQHLNNEDYGKSKRIIFRK